MNFFFASKLPSKLDQHDGPARELETMAADNKVAGLTSRLAALAAVAIFAIIGAHRAAGATPTPTPTPACPSVITQSTSQAIAVGNSGSCNSGSASGFRHTDNGYWRAFNMAVITASQPYHVSSVSFGIEKAHAGTGTTQPVIVRLHRQTSGTFPAGNRTEIANATINVVNQTQAVLSVPLVATVPAGTSQLIMEVFTPDGRILGHSFFIGSNPAAQTGPSYISAPECTIFGPTEVSSVGFATMHLVFNVNGSCGPSTSTPTPTLTPAPTSTPLVTPSPTPIATPSATTIPTATPGVTPQVTPTGTPLITPTPASTPSPGSTPTPGSTSTPPPASTPSPTPASTPTPIPAKALNIATRMRVETGNNVLIGGFIITGSSPKNVAIRGIGPSLLPFGINDALTDPFLELRADNGALIAASDDWQDDSTSASQLDSLGLALQNPKEAGFVVTLQPGASYTAILSGIDAGTGVGLVEIYDANPAADSQLANISTRGFVLTGNNVMIGGFILGGNTNTGIIVRGIGPSLAQFGLSPVLANPTLSLHDGNGALLVSNDNWQEDPASAAQLAAHGLALPDPNESGIFASLPPGAFTAILSGVSDGTGIGLVEIYNVH